MLPQTVLIINLMFTLSLFQDNEYVSNRLRGYNSMVKYRI